MNEAKQYVKPLIQSTPAVSAARLIEEAGVYDIIGIDKTKCTIASLLSTSKIPDSNSVGYVIDKKLQPALEALATSVVLEKNAPNFISPYLTNAKEKVGDVLLRLVTLHRHSLDGHAIDDLTNNFAKTELYDVMPAVNSIVNKVAGAIEKKWQEKEAVRIAAGRAVGGARGL